MLAAKGFIPVEALDGFGAFDSPLGYHPDHGDRAGRRDLERLARPWAADRGRLRARRPPRHCLVGDGELDEGSNWEAVQYAGRIGLGALTAVVIDNHSATSAGPDGDRRRFALEGWHAQRVDGRDHAALEAALAAPSGESGRLRRGGGGADDAMRERFYERRRARRSTRTSASRS